MLNRHFIGIKYPLSFLHLVDRIKRLSDVVLKDHKSDFGEDFADNKKALDLISIIRSKGLKNEIAGYITKFIKKEIREEKIKQARIDAAKSEQQYEESPETKLDDGTTPETKLDDGTTPETKLDDGTTPETKLDDNTTPEEETKTVIDIPKTVPESTANDEPAKTAEEKTEQ